MIVKVVHVSFSAIKEQEKNILHKFKDYQIEFEERNLSNISGKQQLLNGYHMYHDIIMLHDNNKLPIEITLYDKCENNIPMIELYGDLIIVNSNNVKYTKELFKNLGFKEVKGKLYLYTLTDQKEIIIKVNEANFIYNNKLDNEGYSSLAFWVSNIIKDRDRLCKQGYTVTDIESIKVNDRTLDIFFLIGSAYEIIEFIGLGGNK